MGKRTPAVPAAYRGRRPRGSAPRITDPLDSRLPQRPGVVL